MPAPGQQHRARALGALVSLAVLAWAPTAHAQDDGASRLLSSVSASGLARLRADLDRGGDFSVNAFAARARLGRSFGARMSADIGVGYVYEDWSFGTPNALGTGAPWGTIHQPSVSAGMRYRYSDKLTLLASPQVQWAYERGASADDGISYGAVLGGIYTYSPTLTIGLGAAAFRQINRTSIFPFVIVNWQINDKLTLSNPLEAGPTGGPGIELTYEMSDAWDAGIGVAFRDTRFRLRSDGPTPNGIGQDEGLPVFAHLAFTPSLALSIDFYAGAVLDGNTRVLNSNGSTVSSSDYKPQPVLGIRAAYAF
jgi:hypothetical protein